MITIKVTKATTRANSMCKNSRIIGMSITFNDSQFDYECEKYKVNDYTPMLDGEYRLFLYTDGHIELAPRNTKQKSIIITEYEIIN
jgi:hypothetical protein